jgi:hypothetical protein
MKMLVRSQRAADRSDVRAKARGPRRFHRSDEPSTTGQPPGESDDPLWPGPGRPSGPEESHLQWPYWIVLLVPWLTLTAAFLLEHFKVCLMCVPDSVPLPP